MGERAESIYRIQNGWTEPNASTTIAATCKAAAARGGGPLQWAVEQLKTLAGITRDIDINKNRELFSNWSRAVEWDPEQRYNAPGQYTAQTAKIILDSIRAKPNGVLTWLSRRW